MGRAIEVLMLQARAFEAHGDQPQALVALGRALALAEPEGYVRTFIDEGAPIARLLREAQSRGIAPQYGAKLLAALGERVQDAGGRMNAAPHPHHLSSSTLPAVVEPLTMRELELLRLLAAGMSNPEIAQQFVVSINTVKTQIQSIYGKLDVHSRDEAVAKARMLHLVL